jgi:hypothetical protein
MKLTSAVDGGMIERMGKIEFFSASARLAG